MEDLLFLASIAGQRGDGEEREKGLPGWWTSLPV